MYSNIKLIIKSIGNYFANWLIILVSFYAMMPNWFWFQLTQCEAAYVYITVNKISFVMALGGFVDWT